MSEVTKPIALDESLNTTESTPRNIADVLADELVIGDLVTQAQAIVTKLQGIISAVKPDASDIPLDPITGMSANNVQLGISELKGTLDDITNLTQFTCTAVNKTGTTDCVIDTQRNYIKDGIAYFAITLHSVSNTGDIDINIPNNITTKQYGFITVVGKGGRWGVTGAQYLYVGERSLSLNTITANTYYHIMLSIPVNVT